MSRNRSNNGELNLSKSARTLLILLGLALFLGGILLMACAKYVLAIILLLLALLCIGIYSAATSQSGSKIKITGNSFTILPGARRHSIHPEDIPMNPWDRLTEQKPEQKPAQTSHRKDPWEK